MDVIEFCEVGTLWCLPHVLNKPKHEQGVLENIYWEH